ncbi:hypothetical protein BX600DRAFT_477139 [Xylariales sp. PMI_506]|nr:hypothetical protein BX600DRAFT_477139 [Xylariales sp. PMI_506]
MPSVTSLSEWTFTNVGPLTTTWTAPQSCVTQPAVYLAPKAFPDEALYGSVCQDTSTFGACYPGGATQIDAIASADENVLIGGHIPYYSPGLYCPDKYSTVGIAIKDGNGTLISSSGLYAPTTEGTMTIGPGPQTYTETETAWSVQNFTSTHTTVFTTTATSTFAPDSNPYWNVFMEALAPSETAVVCCPSGYSANFWGACYSNVPRTSYTASTACARFITGDGKNNGFKTMNVTFTYDGAPVTTEAEIQTTTSVPLETETAPIPAGTYLDEITGIVFAPAATLVRTASAGNKAFGVVASGLAEVAAIWTAAALVGAVIMIPM